MPEHLFRQSSELDDHAPVSHGVPGKVAVTSRLMRMARDGNGVAEGAESAVDRAASSSGQGLPGDLKGQFESSLGVDLSGVRVHTGAESADAAQSVGARAYATGQDIHFGQGQYDPSSAFGVHLIAHEVAHTVQQQGAAPSMQHKLEVSAPQDAAEVEADRAADAMVAGRTASVSGASPLIAREGGIGTHYSNDDDVKKLPADPAAFQPADGSFGSMAAAMDSMMKSETWVSVPMPASGFAASEANLQSCRNHAESSQVYYSTHTSSRWNPFGSSMNGELAKVAQADAQWSIGMLADVRVAGTATGSWIQLLNQSNKSWADVVKQAKSMSIEVTNKVDKNPLSGLATGTPETKVGDQQVNASEVGGAANELASMAHKLGLKAPDTSAYKHAMQEYNLARNEIAPEQQTIITQLIPTNIAAIAEKKQKATDEVEKWKTIQEATGIFEKGLTVAFGGAGFIEGDVGALGTKEVGGEVKLDSPKGIDPKEAATKATGAISSLIQLKIDAIQKHIAAYDTNLKTYTTVQEAQNLKANVGRLQNAYVKLKVKAKTVEDERTKMETAFQEYGKAIDDAMIKQGKQPTGSKNAQDASALLVAIKAASTNTEGALQGIKSGGAADLGKLYQLLAHKGNERKAEQTGGDGRRDARAPVFGIEGGRWNAANEVVIAITAALGRRQDQLSAIEQSFLSQFAAASGGTDSIK